MKTRFFEVRFKVESRWIWWHRAYTTVDGEADREMAFAAVHSAYPKARYLTTRPLSTAENTRLINGERP